jgi:hypothetical protein
MSPIPMLATSSSATPAILFSPGNMPIPAFQTNTWTHSIMAPHLFYRTHPTAREERPSLLAIMIQACNADLSAPCQLGFQTVGLDHCRHDL